MKSLQIVVCLLLILFSVQGQDSLPGMSYKQLVRQGNKDYKGAYYYDAIRYYGEALRRDSGDANVLLQMGLSCYKIRDYKEALKWFDATAKKDVGVLTTALYYKGLMHKITGDCNTAILDFNAFAANYKGEDKQVRNWVSADLMGCYKMESPDDTFKVDHLPVYVNSGYSDLSPAYWNNTLYFTSIHSDTLVYSKPDTGYVQPYMQIYFSRYKDSMYQEPQLFSALQLADKHISNLSFSKDGKEMFFTLCYGELQQNNCAIWHAVYEDMEWVKTFELSEKVNYPGFASTHPYVTKREDGTDVLWFSSNQPGGQGGFDIWYSEREPGGKFQKAKNAGIVINTTRDEVTPFFYDNTSTLYFSSSGLVSRGGLDVYFAKFKDGKFTLPKSLPEPLNTTYDESFYRLTDRMEGYFVSNRPGVYSVKGETCCDDIFSFEISKAIRPWLKLTAVDSTGTAIEFTRFIIKNSEGKVLDDREKSVLFYQLPANGKYEVSVAKDGYFALQKELVIDAYNSTDTSEIALMLTAVERNKAYRMANIYFDYNSAALNDESSVALDSLVTLLLQNPKIKIEIGSHTDSRGEDDFNMTLSQQRADEVVKYLSNKGIQSNRLQAKGYGESILLQDCTAIDDCNIYDCDCHRLNRRTEFKIIE